MENQPVVRSSKKNEVENKMTDVMKKMKRLKERVQQEVDYLACKPIDWKKRLPVIERLHNDCVEMGMTQDAWELACSISDME